MGVCCSSVVPKYQQHVLALYPDPRSPDEMRTLGGVLAQDDVSKWRLRVPPGDLIAYCRAFPAKLAPAAAMLAKRVRGDLARGRLRAAAIGMQALHALVSGANDGEMLALFEGSVLASLLLCFEHPNTELQILAAQCLCTLLQVQEPANKQQRGGDAYAAYGGIGGGDWSKYQLFYPFVLSMATRNPPPGKLAQISAQAKDLFLDSKERARAEAARSERKRKRVKDLAELEQARAHASSSAAAGGAASGQPATGADGAAAATSSSSGTGTGGGSEDEEGSSHSMLRLHISLWRSRYFGLKALDHLLTLNRDHKASLNRLEEIVPVLLTNFPKNRKSIKAVAAEARLPNPIANVDEAYKPFHSAEEKERAAGADGAAAGGAATLNNNSSSATKDGRVVDFAPASFKEELSARTGITLHHVQLLSYMCLRSVCKLPRITLHLSSLLGAMCAWFDAHQRTVARSALNGLPIIEAASTGAATGGATSAPKLDRAPSKRKDHGHSPADSSPAPLAGTIDGPFAWENLYLSSHVFAELLCAHVPFESGSMDLLVVALMQHAQDMEEVVTAAAATTGGTGTAANSRRGSKAGLGAAASADESLATPSSRDPSADAAAAGGKTTLAQDLKQLFHPRKKAKTLPAGRSPKLAQIAIVQLLNSILNQVASVPLGGVVPVGEEQDTPGPDSSFATPTPPALCLMNFQILLDQLLSMVLAGARALDQAQKNVASGAGAGPSGAGSAAGLSSGAGGDHELLEAERAAEAALAHSVEYLRLLTTVLPSLLIQKFYSFNDVLQALTSVLQLAIAVGPSNRPLKGALLDTAYSMALGLMRWGCAPSAAGSGGEAGGEHARGATSPLTERQNEARGLGLGLGLGLAGGDDMASADARASLSSSSLYESLIQAVLGCAACESVPETRGQAYKILQCVLLTMSGFGGAWCGPTLESAALLLAQSGANGNFRGFNFANLDSLAILSNARSSSELNNNDITSANGTGASVLLKPLLGGSSSDLVEEEAKGGESNGAGPGAGHKLQVLLDGKAGEVEPSPSPRAGGASFAVSARKDLRALRVPQVLASCLDIQSQIHTTASGGSSSAQGGGAPGRGGVAAAGPIATVTLQDHKWILSIIYYEITSCFSAPRDLPAPHSGSAHSGGELKVDPSAGPKDPTAHQLASTILKARGRGATTTENISLCFQLLVLLLLQKHPGAGMGAGFGGGDVPMASSPRDAGSDDLGSVQQELALQLPLLFSVLSFLRSSSSSDEEKFSLSLWSSLRLHHFATTYLSFVGRLLLLSVDSHWVRQQTVALEEMLHQVVRERAAKGEGDGAGAELEPTWLFGLGDLAAPKRSGPVSASVTAAPSAALSPTPTAITTQIDSEQLAGILARLLVDPPSADAAPSNASSSSAQSAAAPMSAMSLHDPTMDEGMEALVAEQKAFLLDSNSFEPFSLKFLLPERSQARFTLRGPGGAVLPFGAATESERENSVSWAPSAMGGGVAGADGVLLGEEPTTGRAGSFFGGLPPAASASSEMDDALQGLQAQIQGQGTPRMQYSPLLRANMAGPSCSPLMLSIPSSTAQGSSSGLQSVPQSPVPQQSVAELLAEMDKQSFQAIATTCARTSVKSREDFTHFMSDLEAATPQTRRSSDAAAAHRAAAKSIAALDASNGAIATLALNPPSDAPEQKQLHPFTSDASLDAALESLGAPLVEEVSESHPDLNVMRPLSASTLELQFPQLASFDLYLHSEIDQ